MSHPDPATPAAWPAYARSDLALADAVPPSGVLLETLCFHAQQAAEKALKAVLIGERQAPPHTHDLDVLIGALDTRRDIPAAVRDATVLTQYAVTSRYPADLGEVDDAEWRSAAKQARAVVEWAEHAVAESR